MKTNIVKISLLFIAYCLYQLVLLLIISAISIYVLLNNSLTMSLFLSNLFDKEVVIEKVTTRIIKDSICLTIKIDGIHINDKNIIGYSEILHAEKLEAYINVKTILREKNIIIDKLLLQNAEITYSVFTNGSNLSGITSEKIETDYSFFQYRINQVQVDNCSLLYYYYDSKYNKEIIDSQPIDSANIYVNKSSFWLTIEHNKYDSLYSNNIFDEYSFKLDTFAGEINTLTVNNESIIRDANINFAGLFLKYIYNINSEKNTLLLMCDGIIFIDSVKLLRTDVFAVYDSTCYHGFVSTDVDFKLNNQTINKFEPLAEVVSDSLLLNNHFFYGNDASVTLKRFTIDWDYNTSNNSEKLVFDTGISLKGISVCNLIKDRDANLSLDCSLNYDYRLKNNIQNHIVEISHLEVNGLNSKLFANQDIVIINDSLQVVDIGMDADLSLVNSFLNVDNKNHLTGRLFMPSLKIVNSITTLDTNLQTFINELEINDARIYDANFYMKDFCHPIKDIVALVSFKNSCLTVSNANFQVGETDIKLNGKLLNPFDFYSSKDEEIKLNCEIYLPIADINTLTSWFSNEVGSDSIKYNIEIPQYIVADIKISCDTLQYKYEQKYEIEDQFLVKQQDNEFIDSFKIYLDKLTNNISDTSDLEVRNLYVSLFLKSGQFNFDNFEFHLGDAFFKSNGIVNNDNNLTLNAEFELDNLNADNILYFFKPYLQKVGITCTNAHIRKIKAKCDFRNLLSIENSLCTLSDVYIAIDSVNIFYPNALLQTDTLFVEDTTLLFKILGKSFYDSTIFERNHNKFGCYQIDYSTTHSFELINPITSTFYKNLFLLYHIKTEKDTLLTFYDNSKLCFNSNNNTKPLRDFLHCNNSSGQLLLPIKTQIKKSNKVLNTPTHFELCLANIDLEVDELNWLSYRYDESIDSILTINNIELKASLFRDSIRINNLSFNTLDGTVIGKDILADFQSQELIKFSVKKFATDSIKFYDILNTLDKTKISIGDEIRNQLNCFNNFSVNCSSHIEETDFFIDDFSSFQNVIDAAIFSAEINANNVNYDKSFNVNIKANFDSKKAKKRPKPNSVKQDIELDFDLSSFANKIIGELTATDDDIEYSINTDLGSSKLTAKWLENEELSVNLNGNTRIGDYIVMQTDSSEYYDMIKDIIIESINIDVLPDSTIIDLKVKDFDLILPHKVKMLLGDLKLSDVFSKKPEIKAFELNLTVLDQEEKIIIDSFILEISPKYIMSVTGQYKNSHLEVDMLMISPKLTARDYQIKLSYYNQILDVDIVGVGLFGSILSKLVGNYGDQIAEQFGETDKYLNNLIKIKRKEFRKDKRKDRREARKKIWNLK